MQGKFISFEGIDGSGKSTQLRMLTSDLRSRGLDIVSTCEPGGTPLGKRLRGAFLETEENVAPMAELLLFAADRAQHVELLIKPTLAAGRIVVSDRFADATAAYQGAGRGFDKALVAQIIHLATGGLMPDLTLYFDVPVETAVSRLEARGGEKNRMDRETFDFYTRVRDEYLEIGMREPKRFIVIDGSGSPEGVRGQVLNIIGENLGIDLSK